MSHKRKYDKEFKKSAVELLRSSGESCNKIARDLGINESLLRSWNKQYDDPNCFPGNGNPIDKEIYELKKELALIKEERDILKKAIAIFLKRIVDKYKVVTFFFE